MLQDETENVYHRNPLASYALTFIMFLMFLVGRISGCVVPPLPVNGTLTCVAWVVALCRSCFTTASSRARLSTARETRRRAWSCRPRRPWARPCPARTRYAAATIWRDRRTY